MSYTREESLGPCRVGEAVNPAQPPSVSRCAPHSRSPVSLIVSFSNPARAGGDPGLSFSHPLFGVSVLFIYLLSDASCVRPAWLFQKRKSSSPAARLRRLPKEAVNVHCDGHYRATSSIGRCDFSAEESLRSGAADTGSCLSMPTPVTGKARAKRSRKPQRDGTPYHSAATSAAASSTAAAAASA